MTLNLDDLERVVNLSGAHVKDHLVWPRAEIAALIAKLREAERERDEARWAAGIVGDVARESSGGWQDATAGLHATQARLREAEAVIAKELSRHREKHGETPRFAPDDYQHELEPTHWEPYVICDACGTFWPCKTTQTLVYKPTNQEGES